MKKFNIVGALFLVLVFVCQPLAAMSTPCTMANSSSDMPAMSGMNHSANSMASDITIDAEQGDCCSAESCLEMSCLTMVALVNSANFSETAVYGLLNSPAVFSYIPPELYRFNRPPISR